MAVSLADPAAALGFLATGALISATNFALVVGVAAAGAAVTEGAGVLNLTHEGVMLLGAAAGFLAAVHTSSPGLGALAGIGAGLALGAVKAIWSVVIQTDQVINGLLLVPIGAGLSNLLFHVQPGPRAASGQLPPSPPEAIPLLASIPVLGPVLFQRSVLAYGAVLLVAATAYFLGRTRVGLIVRTAGGSPATLHYNGRSVAGYRILAVLIGTGMTGFAGALLAVDQLHLFHPAMTAGRGWIATAVVIVAGWRPWRCLLVAFLFGLTDMVQFQLQIESRFVPYEVLLSLPYLVTVAVLAVRWSKVKPPVALGRPYFGASE